MYIGFFSANMINWMVCVISASSVMWPCALILSCSQRKMMVQKPQHIIHLRAVSLLESAYITCLMLFQKWFVIPEVNPHLSLMSKLRAAAAEENKVNQLFENLQAFSSSNHPGHNMGVRCVCIFWFLLPWQHYASYTTGCLLLSRRKKH